MSEILEYSQRFEDYDSALNELYCVRTEWPNVSPAERIVILQSIKDALQLRAPQWAELAAEKKQIPAHSPLVGEEWLSGPYALMAACNIYMNALSALEDKSNVRSFSTRWVGDDQIAVRVTPHSIWERLLLSGVTAEIWMEQGVTGGDLPALAAPIYGAPENGEEGKVALVLGAGNIASIAPLDCFQKLFAENQVVLLKLNPTNDYLFDVFCEVMQPLIEKGVLRIVKGGSDVGEYLCNHPNVDEIHITGAESTHDAIVWGVGEDAANNKARGTPKNHRRMTSELGGVSPTIIVPGPWSKDDILYQAQHIATQKLHNSGFNCVACQMLVLPQDWPQRERLFTSVLEALRNSPDRGLYYPGAEQRLIQYARHAGSTISIPRKSGGSVVVGEFDGQPPEWCEITESFSPALSVNNLPSADGAVAYLERAIEYANTRLHGTLGANIVIHPKTRKEIGKSRFDALIKKLRYGTIAINAWTGLGFLMPQVPWGAYPGHTLEDVQSGIGLVHNGFMFDRVERSVVEGPFRPFPRSVMNAEWSLLPKPPWFVTNRTQHKTAALLTDFQYAPSWRKIPLIFWSALHG